MELYARHMLFTALTLEGKHRIGLQGMIIAYAS